MNDQNHRPGKEIADDLTWREQEVLNLLGNRLTNREIADRLFLTENTVKDYVSRILGKLYVKNRREAVERAKVLGLLGTESAREITEPVSSQLPPEKTPFVGRLKELKNIRHELGQTRLLTLVGPGGIGKTRLAIKAAESFSADFRDGIYLVSLAPILSVKDIIQTVAESLKFPIATQEDPGQQLKRYLEEKQLLLIMDNFEHLLDGVDLLSEILTASPWVKIIATSRERLNLQAEMIHQVMGMDFPLELDVEEFLAFDAVQLFIQTASKLRPGFDPTEDELRQIAQICQKVGGMPLAIELAAAWLHVLGVNEIAAELGEDLDILATEVRDAPKRHRSIRAVFDHSWTLLDPSEQEIFVRASIFRGGFTRDAIEQVTGASIRHLAGLANKSFLNHDPGSGRYEIHELLRQYAREQLEKTPDQYHAVQEAHAAYYAEFMEHGWALIKSREQLQALDEIEADIENVRAAWRYALEHRDTSKIWQFIYCLWHFHYIRWWNRAGLELFTEAVETLQGDEGPELIGVISLAITFKGYFMTWMGLPEQAFDIVQQVITTLEKLDNPRALVFAYESLGMSAYFLHRYEEQIQLMDKMMEVAEQVGDKWLLGYAFWCRGISALVEDDFEGARQFARTNLAYYEEVGEVSGVATPLIILGHAAFGKGDLNEARDYYRRALIISEETKFYYAIQTVAKYLCRVCITLGDYSEAEENLVKSLKIANDIYFVRDQVNLLYEYARLQVAYANVESAVEILALVIEHPSSDLYRMLEGRISDSARNLLGEIKDQISPEKFQHAYQAGQQLDFDAVISDLLKAA